MGYEFYLTVVCIITTALGMVLAWSWGYREGHKIGFRRGRAQHPAKTRVK